MHERHLRSWTHPSFADDFGGAEGIRTLDLLDAIEARFQLRHGPTGRTNFYNTRFAQGQTASTASMT
jgi:hypothetical protein